MPLAFKRLDAKALACGLILGLPLGLASAFTAKPLYQSALQNVFRARFYQLTKDCDEAMRMHLLAKNRLELDPSRQAVQQLRSAELGLLACQDYDLMRKRLIRWGLDDNALSELTLEFAESRGKELHLVVETHEFRY